MGYRRRKSQSDSDAQAIRDFFSNPTTHPDFIPNLQPDPITFLYNDSTRDIYPYSSTFLYPYPLNHASACTNDPAHHPKDSKQCTKFGFTGGSWCYWIGNRGLSGRENFDETK
jgi:hypothetical protein